MADRRKRQRYDPVRRLDNFTLDRFWSRKKKERTVEDSEGITECTSSDCDHESVSDSFTGSNCDADISQSESSVGQPESSTVSEPQLQAPQGKVSDLARKLLKGGGAPAGLIIKCHAQL